MRLIDKYKVYPYASIHKNVWYQPYGIVKNWELYNVTRTSKNFIQRLKKWCTLDGHEGCVNTVSWNSSGTLLLSGSDDYLINIYDIYSEKMLHSIESGHRANIFSAKFLPCTSDMKIVSCSGDGMLHYNELGTNYGEHFFNCHSGTTYEVLVTPGDPNTFLSCGEDGTVRLFDLRTKNKCHCQECSEDILIDTRHAVTSVSLNPLSPYHLAAGCKDSYVRVFDRRTLGTSVNTRSVNRNRGWMPGLFCKFKPEKLRKDASCRITSLRYSNDGRSILVSYCTDYVYTFAVNDNEGKYMDSKETKVDVYSSNGSRSCPESESNGLPPVKRLRLRGDWSDTGPQARPETADENVPESNLMQRMSELFSRWLEDAISSPLERQVSYGSNTSLENEAEGNQTGDVVSSQNIIPEDKQGNDSNDSNTKIGNNEHPDVSDEPSLERCHSEAPLDSADTTNTLCIIGDEQGNDYGEGSNEIVCYKADDDNKNENNDNNNNSNDNDSNFDYDNIFTGESNNTANLISQNKSDIKLTPFSGGPMLCKNENSSTSSSQSNDYNKTSKFPISCSSNSFLSNSCNVVSTSAMEVNEFEPGITVIRSDNLLDERTLWPDDFNTGYDDSSSIDENMEGQIANSEETPGMILKETMSTQELNQSQSVCDVESWPLSDMSMVYEECKDRSVCMSQHEGEKMNSECSTSVNQVQSSVDQDISVQELVGSFSSCTDGSLSKCCNVKETDNEKGSSAGMSHHLGNNKRQYIDVDNSDIEPVKHFNLDCTNDSNVYNCTSKVESSCVGNLEKDISKRKHFDESVDDSIIFNSNVNNEYSKDNLASSTVLKDRMKLTNLLSVGRDRNINFNSSGNINSNEEAPSCSENSSLNHSSFPSVLNETSDVPESSSRTENTTADGSQSFIDMGNSSDISPDNRDSDTSQVCSDSMRERAATRIQKFLRSNRGKFCSSEENFNEDANPVFLPTKYSTFKGHRNARTMIKEANFWGDDYILSGSDCGRIFIWDRHTGDLVMLLQGDSHVVNCVQPHPFDPILASSGIDHDVKIWAPLADEAPDLTDMDEIVNRNEQMLEESRDTITVPASFVLRMLASFGSRRRRRTSYRRMEEDTDDTER